MQGAVEFLSKKVPQGHPTSMERAASSTMDRGTLGVSQTACLTHFHVHVQHVLEMANLYRIKTEKRRRKLRRKSVEVEGGSPNVNTALQGQRHFSLSSAVLHHQPGNINHVITCPTSLPLAKERQRARHRKSQFPAIDTMVSACRCWLQAAVRMEEPCLHGDEMGVNETRRKRQQAIASRPRWHLFFRRAIQRTIP